MKLSIREDSTNYACTVVKLPPKQAVVGLDKLVKVTVFGNDVLTQKDSDEDQLYLFFPAECAINPEYLSINNEFRETSLNKNREIKGYFEPNGRVKAVKFKGVISTGYLAPVSTLSDLAPKDDFKVGDEFTDFENYEGYIINLCKKYIPKRQQSQGQGNAESKHNKKLKRFNKLVPNQFRFHNDTAHLAKNLHMFNPDDIIVITDKWHGTSAVFSNVLIRKELTLMERFLIWLGFDIVTLRYDRLYSSRSVIKNQYINREAGAGYYGEDIWGIVNKELEHKIEQGITLYGEIVGYLPSGKPIQKGYDYGCDPDGYPHVDTSGPVVVTTRQPKHKFLVYRITYTKPNGEVIEYSWQQIKDYCKKYALEHVKEILFVPGKGCTWDHHCKDDVQYWRNLFFVQLSDLVNKEDNNCPHCKNRVPAEGICVRIDGKQNYMTYKLKSKRFLEKETKALDAGEENIEDFGEVDAGIVDYE